MALDDHPRRPAPTAAPFLESPAGHKPGILNHNAVPTMPAPMDPQLADLIVRHLTTPVEPIRLVVDPGSPTLAQGAAALALVRAIAAAVPNVILDARDPSPASDDPPGPTIVIDGPVAGGRLRYRGVPQALEMEGFFAALGLVANPTEPDPATLGHLRGVQQDVELLVFVTPSCWQCPQVVRAAQRLALASPFVTTTVVDATGHADLVRRHHVLGVPKVVSSSGMEHLGPVSEDELARAVAASVHAADTPPWAG